MDMSVKEQEQLEELEEETDPTPKGSVKESEEDAEKTKQEEMVPKQQLEQERANARRARQALEEAAEERDNLANELEALKAEQASLRQELKGTLTANELQTIQDLDPENTDVPDLVKHFQKQQEKIAALSQELDEAKEFIKSQKTQAETQRQTDARRQREEEIYSSCDEEFGAQFRNDAIKLADKMVEDHEVDPPKNWVQGYRLMRKAYAQVAAKAKPAETKRKHVPTDTGVRGLNLTDLDDSEEYKPGTLDEVAADMGKKMKAGKWKGGAFEGQP